MMTMGRWLDGYQGKEGPGLDGLLEECACLTTTSGVLGQGVPVYGCVILNGWMGWNERNERWHGSIHL